MTLPVPDFARRLLGMAVLLLPLPLVAANPPGALHAEHHAPRVTMPSPQDAPTEALKNKVLELDSQIQTLQQQMVYPAYSRVSLYVGVRIPNLLIRKIQVSIDGGTPVTVEYHRGQSIALLRGGLDRILRINVKPGLHRVHATFTGQYDQAKKGKPPVKMELNAAFRKKDQPVQLEVQVYNSGFIASPHLRLLQWIRQS